MALTIHLGAHKTASTHLQQSVRQVRDRLLAAGVFHADPVLLRGSLPLAAALAKGPGSVPARRFSAELRRMRAGLPDLLLSEENILGGTHRERLHSARGVIYPEAQARVRQVIAMAGGGPATLLLAVRDPAAFHVSAFALQLSLGNEIELGAYLGGRDPARAGWAGLVARLAALEEAARIVVWRYEDYRQLRPRILALMLPPGLAALVPEPPPANVSLSQPGYEWFLRRAMADSEVDLRILAGRACRRFDRGAGHAPLRLLPEEDYRRSAANYARAIARLRRMPKVELLEP